MRCIVHIEPCDRTRRVVARVLSAAGYPSVPAASLPSRWDIGLPAPVDLVIVDVAALRPVPDVAMREVRRRAPGAGVLVTTASDVHGVLPGADSAAPAGAFRTCRDPDGVLRKPFENDQLLAEVSRLLSVADGDGDGAAGPAHDTCPVL